MTAEAARLLAAHAALPEAYQPAWGLDASRGRARRACDDRLEVILPPLEALPCEGTLRVLDLGCAQGYFTLAIAHALAQRGRPFEIIGVDYLEDNILFCEMLAAYHGLHVGFVHAPADAAFIGGREGAGPDVILALNVLHHVQRQQQGEAESLLEAIRTHSRVAFCELAQREEGLEWVGEWHAADPRLLGTYAFHRCLARFPTHLGDVRRPLYVCSDAQAWVGDRWFQFERVCERSHAGVPDAFAGERRFLFGRNEIVKAYRGEGPYGAFNRAELNAEAAALAVLAGEPDRYPEVSGRSDDGDAVWLARGRLPGRLLSEYFDDDRRIDRAVVVRGLLDELAHLESRGFHHGDLRCWNVLVDEDRVRLIDFGALTREPSPLHRIALAAILLEIAEGKLRHHQPFYATLHPLSAYPAAWRSLVRYLLETPQRTFHFARAAESLGEEVARRGHGPDTRLAPATDVMVAAAQEQVEGFRRLQGHLEETERRLVAASGEFAAAAAERALLERGRGVAEAHALSLAKALSESQHYAESLRQSLDQSTDFADSLQARILRETADARAERETFAVSQRDAAAHAATLEQSLRESRAYADSLKEALAGSRLHAESLQARILRETADIRAEREAMQVSQREAAVHAATLEQSLGESQAYANSLKEALEGSQQYAESLQARLAREATDALAERQAWQISQRDAAAHAAALGQALRESRAYADSLKEALESSHLYAGSLQQRLEREAGDASRERAKLMADLARWQARHARMQYRFRLLKFLWPHEDPKEPE